MGLFEDLGRKAERFKRAVEGAADGEATHGCRDCEALFYTDHDYCPECGGDDVVALE